MSKKLAPVITLLLASVLPVFPQTSVQGSAQNQNAGLQDPVIRTSPHKGDLDEMDQRRVVRALVTFNRASFFFDNGRPRGMTYDALVDFEKFLNRELHPKDTTGKEKINVVFDTNYLRKSRCRFAERERRFDRSSCLHHGNAQKDLRFRSTGQ